MTGPTPVPSDVGGDADVAARRADSGTTGGGNGNAANGTTNRAGRHAASTDVAASEGHATAANGTSMKDARTADATNVNAAGADDNPTGADDAAPDTAQAASATAASAQSAQAAPSVPSVPSVRAAESSSTAAAASSTAPTASSTVESATAPSGWTRGAGRQSPEVESAIQALWREFSSVPSQRVRDRLVLHYAPLVKYVAGRVGTGLPTHVDVADLIQSGIFGLVDAIEKFDPDRGLRFETYAMQRIRGAILDDLRSQDWVPRVIRSRAREVERAHDRLGARLRRSPTDAEVAAELGISLDELRDLYGQFRLTSVAALEDLVTAGRESGSLGDSLRDDDAVDPAAVLVDRDNRRQLADAIAQLADRDRTVVSLYYFESLTLAEIGKVLGVTESRVSQLHTRAVLRLRAKLAEQAPV